MSDQVYDQTYDAAQLVGDYAPPTVRVTATYPPTMTGPESMTVDLNVSHGATLGIDIRATVLALASVGMVASVEAR